MGHLHPHRKQVVNRLAIIEGHVRSVKEMASNDRECSDLLVQLGAIRSAIDKCAKLILKDHLEGCVQKAISEGDEKVIRDFNRAIDTYLK
ncbi:metal-sensing transcriptional repressor [Bacillus carboniphilus]|uniref:Metal-sensing transcriptional repressor n=1 Tax=Bacillus carboniphilus TaxID=86663 RepID=A0ABN0WAE0_9BACI